MQGILRSVNRVARSTSRLPSTPKNVRPFHTPFAVLGSSPLTKSPPPTSNVSSMYEKQTDPSPEPTTSHSGTRTYVVSEPDTTSKYYEVPSGAYPTSAPYVNFTSTEAPNTHGAQTSSTSADVLAHPQTRAAPQHEGGVGESAAVRNSAAPGEMGKRGGSSGGLGLMDKEGTVAGEGELAERNPPPIGDVAEQFSKQGIKDAWKSRK